MSTVDDELTRRLQRAERPVDGDDLLEDLTRRRSHLERVRRVQAGMLALAVLAATAGGFVALRSAFGNGGRDVGNGLLASNGQIVFVREGTDGRSHLYAAEPDGSDLRLITDGTANDTDPAVSPDGRTVAYVRAFEDTRQLIATVPVDGGTVTPVTEDDFHAADPAWSPDGTRIAYVTTGIDSQQLSTVDATGRKPRVVVDFFGQLADPTWSADGDEVTFAARGYVGTFNTYSWDLATVVPGAAEAQIEPLLLSEGDEEAPAWAPDGTRIAFIRQGEEGDEVWTIAPDGGSETLLAIAVEASLEPDLAWAPDGSAVLVSDGEWIYRVDATPRGDERDNFVQLVEGHSPSWQPLPVGSQPSAATDPESSVSPDPSPSPEPDGRDIGLGFPLCDLQRLDRIDWYGERTNGSAWTGARTTDDGRCPPEGTGGYVVAADLDGDGSAEPGGMGFLEHCLFCRPFAATDLNADGVLELIVLEEASSTPSYSIYEASVPTSERSPGIYSLFVAPPGHPEANLPANGPIRFIVGGDEGFSGGVRCVNYPEAPVIVYTWFLGKVDADTDLQGHETRLRLGKDGIFHVLDTRDFSVGRDEPTNISTAPACGVDFHPAA